MTKSFSSLRREAGYTQEQLAATIESERSTIAKWETGRAYPKVSTIPRLAAILNVTEGEIIAAITAAKQDTA